MHQTVCAAARNDGSPRRRSRNHLAEDGAPRRVAYPMMRRDTLPRYKSTARGCGMSLRVSPYRFVRTSQRNADLRARRGLSTTTCPPCAESRATRRERIQSASIVLASQQRASRAETAVMIITRSHAGGRSCAALAPRLPCRCLTRWCPHCRRPREALRSRCAGSASSTCPTAWR